MDFIQYQLTIDQNRDGSITPLEIQTALLLQAEWHNGFSSLDEGIAPAAHAHFTLQNDSGVWANPLWIGCAIRLNAIHNGLTYTCYSGRISHVQLRLERGRWLAVIHATDASHALHGTRLSLAPQLNQTADAIIQTVVQAVGLWSADSAGRWLLGRIGQAELGQNTRLPHPVPTQLDVGKTRFAYVGDEGIRAASDWIGQVVQAERGVFYVTREGVLTFRNRHTWLQNETPLTTLNDSLDDLQADVGGEVVSTVTVMGYPRTVSESPQVIWRNPSPISLPPRTRQTLRLTWQTDDGLPMAVLSLMPPVRDVNYRFSRTADGGNLTPVTDVALNVLAWDAAGADIELVNSGSRTLYLLTGATLSGVILRRESPIQATASHYATRNLYRMDTVQIDLPALDSSTQADSYARYELGQRATPQVVIRQVVISAWRHPTDVLARTIGDCVRVTVSGLQHSADYRLIGESHHLSQAGAQHRTTWRLSPLPLTPSWILGRRALARQTTLTY